MNYGNIPDKVLKVTFDDGWNTPSTLKQELGRVNEDIVFAEWRFWDKTKSKTLVSFTAWTKSYVVFLVEGAMGDQYITYLDRNPPASTTSKKSKRSTK